MTDLNIILEIIKEIEQKEKIINVTGAKGKGIGRIRVNKPHSVSKNLGSSMSEEQGQEKEEYEFKPVKISKAFKRRKNDN